MPADVWVDFRGTVPEIWKAMARDKGFRIHRRVRDRLHLALECCICGSLTAHKVYTLRTAQPRCGGCAEADLIAQARKAGLVLLRRDQRDRHYALYRGKCGHVLKRQFELVNRVANGLTDVKCRRCLIEREQEEARKQGWERVRRDRSGNPSYREYRHPCGQVQRIARGNLQWGQCDCARYSKHPVKRWRHQLKLPKSAQVDVIRVISMPTGHDASGTERAAHAALMREHPDFVVPNHIFADVLNVVSEVYWPAAEGVIQGLLDGIEARYPTKIS